MQRLHLFTNVSWYPESHTVNELTRNSDRIEICERNPVSNDTLLSDMVDG